MRNLTKKTVKFIPLIILLFFSSILWAGEAEIVLPKEAEELFQEAKQLRLTNPEASIQMFQKVYNQYTKLQDTSKMISALMAVAYTYGHQAKYESSYNNLWKALLLADKANLEQSKASIYTAIGRHYSFYNRKKEALEFLNLGLNIRRQLVKENAIDPAKLVQHYHPICATYRELNEPDLSKVYLDSSFLYYKKEVSRLDISFLKFEKAVLLNKSKKYEEAIAIFQSILPFFQKKAIGYQVLVYNYMGNSYKKLNNFLESEHCYKKSLELSDKYNSHIDFTPLVYGNLAELYYQNKEYIKGYQNLEKAKALDFSFFDSRSRHNRHLLEIQDAFRDEKDKQAIVLKEQRLYQLEQDEKVLFLEKSLLIGFILFLLLFGVLYFNYVRTKHRNEKQFIAQKQELEIQKTKEILEMKNKELADSALQLIEKETFINTLKKKLLEDKGDIKRTDIEKIIQSASNRNIDNWREFETRFMAINKVFYDRISKLFPDLTQGDRKLCALIKLNFSSKEIAKLLNMSVESVHTSRSRLRKKLKLKRQVNLTKFIAAV